MRCVWRNGPATNISNTGLSLSRFSCCSILSAVRERERKKGTCTYVYFESTSFSDTRNDYCHEGDIFTRREDMCPILLLSSLLLTRLPHARARDALARLPPPYVCFSIFWNLPYCCLYVFFTCHLHSYRCIILLLLLFILFFHMCNSSSFAAGKKRPLKVPPSASLLLVQDLRGKVGETWHFHAWC